MIPYFMHILIYKFILIQYLYYFISQLLDDLPVLFDLDLHLLMLDFIWLPIL